MTKTPALQNFLIFDVKNNVQRNLEIEHMLHKDEGTSFLRLPASVMAYVPLQHLAPKVLANVKRANIKQDDLFSRIADYHRRGLKVYTDILFVLPGESPEDAMTTWRRCFEIGFDHIKISRTYMLAGSELETKQQRDLYGIKTKFIITPGLYGQYQGKYGMINTIESYEVIVSTSSMSDEEHMSLYMVIWLVNFGYNRERWLPFLKYLYQVKSVNPLDVFLKITNGDKKNFPKTAEFFERLYKDLKNSLFETTEEIKDFYKDKMESLYRFNRMELFYNAMFISDKLLYREFCQYLAYLFNEDSDPIIDGIINYMENCFVDTEQIMKGLPVEDIILHIPGKAAKYILPDDIDDINKTYKILLYKPTGQVTSTRDFLAENAYETDKWYAVVRLLCVNFRAMIYDVKLT